MKHNFLIYSIAAFLFSGAALADDCQVEISANDVMQYSTDELSVPSSCKEVTVTLTHTGTAAKSAMGHNWVLAKSDDFQGVASDSMSAGLDNNYVPAGDARVLASTKVIGGGEKTSVTFSLEGLSSKQEYMFFCTFPGHWAMMKGTFKITG